MDRVTRFHTEPLTQMTDYDIANNETLVHEHYEAFLEWLRKKHPERRPPSLDRFAANSLRYFQRTALEEEERVLTEFVNWLCGKAIVKSSGDPRNSFLTIGTIYDIFRGWWEATNHDNDEIPSEEVFSAAVGPMIEKKTGSKFYESADSDTPIPTRTGKSLHQETIDALNDLWDQNIRDLCPPGANEPPPISG